MEQSQFWLFDAFKNKIVQLNTQDAYGIVPRNAEQSFALNVLMNDRIQLVILTGKAGTGKTLLALASVFEKRKLINKFSLLGLLSPSVTETWGSFQVILIQSLPLICNLYLIT